MYRFVWTSFFLLYFSLILFAQKKVFNLEYTYNLSNLDSQITAEAITQNRAKDSLASIIYRSIEHSLETKSELHKNIDGISSLQVISMIPCIIEIATIKDAWIPDSYYIKLETSFDTALFINRLNKISRTKEEVERIERLKIESDKANIQIETLKESINTNDFEDNKFRLQIEYVENINKLQVKDLFQKGYLAFIKMEYDTAISNYRKMIDLAPNNEFGYYNLALNYTELGNDDEAIKFYKETVKISPRFANAHYNLGILYAKNGDEYNSNRYLQKAARLNHKKAKELLRPK